MKVYRGAVAVFPAEGHGAVCAETDVVFGVRVLRLADFLEELGRAGQNLVPRH